MSNARILVSVGCLATVSGAAVAPGQPYATVYSNFGPGDSYDGTQWFVAGQSVASGPNEKAAMCFTPTNTAVLTDLWLALVHCDSNPWNEVSIEIRREFMDDGGGGLAPGDLVADPIYTAPQWPLPECDCQGTCGGTAPFHLDLRGHYQNGLILAAGRRYWLFVHELYPAIPPDPGPYGNRWHFNDQNDVGDVATYNDATSTWEISQGTLAAFRIGVEPPAGGCFVGRPPAEPLPETNCNAGEAEIPTAPSPFESMCWYQGINARFSSYRRDGFPLNINLWQGFGPGDYPPLSTDPRLGSSPLVSGEVRHFGGRSPYRERPTHNGAVDLITGQPLLRAVDFELPFGGASFRHVRTYSENFSKIWVQGHTYGGGFPAHGAFWDWNGLFWMMGENPILLVDARYSDLNGKPIVTPDAKRCYLIPDAHHAVPFLYHDGDYTAPSWFDAILDHNGIPDSVNDDEWATWPTEFTVWLNRRTVKYTFIPRYEDHWNVEDPTVGSSVPAHRPAAEGDSACRSTPSSAGSRTATATGSSTNTAVFIRPPVTRSCRPTPRGDGASAPTVSSVARTAPRRARSSPSSSSPPGP